MISHRPDINALRDYLKELGATQVLTYDDLEDRSLRNAMREWPNFHVGRPPSVLLLHYGDECIFSLPVYC